jgi:hypothetical protein
MSPATDGALGVHQTIEAPPRKGSGNPVVPDPFSFSISSAYAGLTEVNSLDRKTGIRNDARQHPRRIQHYDQKLQ